MKGASHLRVVVADDEPLARGFLADSLAKVEGVEVVATCADGHETVRAVQESGPDLLFLDIQMPGLDGFGVLSKLPRGALPAVVFVTAFDEYAVRAFEVEALDYLLKPFDEERLEATLSRAKARLENGGGGRLDAQIVQALAALRRAPPARRLAVHEGDRIRLVDAAAVEWVEADRKQVKLHLGGIALQAKQSIGSLEAALDPEQFVRVSRSAIVNLSHVHEIQPWFQGQYLLVMTSGAKVSTTRTYRARLDSLIKRKG